MSKKVNPIISGRLFPFVPNRSPKKAGKNPSSASIKSNPIIGSNVPHAGQVKHSARNAVIITSALALATFAITKGIKDYKTNHKTGNTQEISK